MEKAIKVTLTRAARKTGGDRYESDGGGEKPFVVYVPQIISRKADGVPFEHLTVTFRS